METPTKEQLLITRAKQLVDPDFKPSPSTHLGLCFRDTVLIRKVAGTENNTTEGGIILAESDNTNKPNMGIVEAVGPMCSDHILPGLKVLYNQYANLECLIKGAVYHLISEKDVYFALTAKTYARVDPKSDKEVRLEKKHAQQETYLDNKYVIEQNQKDKLHDSTKGKIKLIKPQL